jgi:hypothetical protein
VHDQIHLFHRHQSSAAATRWRRERRAESEEKRLRPAQTMKAMNNGAKRESKQSNFMSQACSAQDGPGIWIGRGLEYGSYDAGGQPESGVDSRNRTALEIPLPSRPSQYASLRIASLFSLFGIGIPPLRRLCTDLVVHGRKKKKKDLDLGLGSGNGLVTIAFSFLYSKCSI